MWLFTTIGFFSVVQKPRQSGLTIRARVAADLDQLRERYVPSLSATIVGAGSDYPYRATVRHEEFAQALGQMARDITYANFKSEVARKAGHRREQTYGKVWRVLHELEEEPAGAKGTA